MNTLHRLRSSVIRYLVLSIIAACPAVSQGSDAPPTDGGEQFELGKAYAAGNGVPKDATKALEWYAKSAAQGNAGGQYALGCLYYQGGVVAKDRAKAVELYHKAGEQGYADAQCALGWAYDHGEGVAKDAAKALEWYAKAAAQGHAQAISVIQALTPKTRQSTGASSSNVLDLVNLGVRYGKGEGVPKDSYKAVELFKRAAVQGDATAQFNLGVMYEFGEGTEKDLVKAHICFDLASAGGNAASLQRLAIVKREMTILQISEAEQNARSFVPKRETAAATDVSSPSQPADTAAPSPSARPSSASGGEAVASEERLAKLEKALAAYQSQLESLTNSTPTSPAATPSSPINPANGNPLLWSQVTDRSLGRVYIPNKGWLEVGPDGPIDNGASNVRSRVLTRKQVAERDKGKAAAKAGMSVDDYQRQAEERERERKAEKVRQDMGQMRIEIDRLKAQAEQAAFEQMKTDRAKLFKKD